MEKWKIGVIALLVLAMAGYGVLQQKSAQETPPTPPAGTQNAAWVGKTLPAWPSIQQWINTPAPIDLGKWKGSVTFVEVFRTECPHCQDAAPFLVALNARYKTRGLNMVSIESPGDYKDPQNPENQWLAVQKWMKDRKVTWPAGFDKNSQWFQKTAKGSYYPSMFILDKSGKVVFFQTGHTQDKAIDLAYAIETQMVGSKPSAAQIQNLATWLAGVLFGGDATLQKALVKDLTERK